MKMKLNPSLGKVKIPKSPFRQVNTQPKEKEIECLECDGTGKNLQKPEEQCTLCKGKGTIKGKAEEQKQ